MATRGRKPKPTNLKLVQGNPGKRAINKGEPKPPAGDALTPPSFLNAPAKVEWARVLGDLQRCGLVTTIDRAALAGYCQAYGTWTECDKALKAAAKLDRANAKAALAMLMPGDKVGQAAVGAQLAAAGLLATTTNGNVIQSVLLGARNRAMELCLKFGAEFGMTPSARSRIDVSIGDSAPAAGQGQAQGKQAATGGPGSYLT